MISAGTASGPTEPAPWLALTGLTSLDLGSNSIGADGARALAALTGLTSLALGSNSIGADGARALAALTGLTRLYLGSNNIGDDGARALAALTGLTSLDLHNNGIGADGARALAALTGLTSLDLRNNGIGADGARALTALTGLTSLDLSSNDIGADGARALTVLTGLTCLDLSFNGIGADGASALAALTSLTSLHLGWNSIGDDGAHALAALTSLTSLHLSSNGIGADGASALTALTGLTSLHLNFNSIGGDGARALAALTGLTSLYLGSNSIGDDGARALAALTGLTRLYLAFNGIGDDGASALAALTGLTCLDLSFNGIGDISSFEALNKLENLTLSKTQIRTACPNFWLKPALREVYLCDVVLGDAPREVLSRESDDNCLERLRAHFRDKALGRSEVVRDVKVMILGNGRIGKTQICRRLIGWQALGLDNESEEFEKNARSTHGVQVWRAILPSPQSPGCAEIPPTPLHIWDFGGQDIYLSTHSLFLRTRAIFPIVWTPQCEEEPDHTYAGFTSRNFKVEYWARYTAQMAGRDRPLMLIQNQWDTLEDRQRTPRIDPDFLDSFAFHPSLAYSAKTKQGHASLIDCLQQAVAYIHEKEGLKSIGGGRAWIKRELETRRAKAQEARQTGRADPKLSVMDKAEFISLCHHDDCVAAGGVSDPDALLDYLHQIGAVFYQLGLFGGRIIVDQQWALEAIYALFERESGVARHIINYRNGRFTRSEVARFLWDVRGYGEAEQELFVDMMRSCRIAFRLREAGPEGGEPEYLAPDLLPPKAEVEERLDWDDDVDAEKVVFSYDLLPPSLLRSLMVQIGELAGVSATYWRDGFSFYERRTRSRAMIQQVQEEKGWGGYIEISTQLGDAEALLAVLARMVEADQDQLGVEPGALPRFDHSRGLCGWFEEAIGQGVSKDKKETAALAQKTQVLRQGLARDVHGDDNLADGVRLLNPGPEPQPAKACYISYAWGSLVAEASPEEQRREKVVDDLCALYGTKGVKIIRDRDVMRFGDSIVNFMNQIVEGQKIFVVLSNKYLHSPFCMYELYHIWIECRQRAEAFRERVQVISLPDAAIYSFDDRLALARRWDAEFKKQKREVSKTPHLVSVADFATFQRMGKFALDIGEILSLVVDTLHPSKIERIEDLRLD